MQEQRLKVGIVGLGEIAQIIHLPILMQMSDRYEIVALCDISKQLLHYIGKHYRVKHLYTDIHEMAAQEDIDVIFVLNSNEYHTESVIAAINNHKHVFVEKPMCFTLREADEIIEARDAAGVQVMVGYMRRFAPAFLRGVEEVKQLGHINYARIRDIIGQNAFFIDQIAQAARFNDIPASARADRAERFEAMMKEATGTDSPQIHSIYNTLCGLNGHDFSAMREMLGFPHQVLSAAQGPGQFLTAIFEFDGYNATFETGIDHQGRFDASLEVFGETRTIRVQYNTPYIRHLPTRLFVAQTVGEKYTETEVRPSYTDPYTLELEYLYDSLTGDQQPKTTPEDFKEDLLLNQMILDELKYTQGKAQTRKKILSSVPGLSAQRKEESA
ncbi:Gfo/Idh/MocA family oxidoreductase [Ktedonosporobacter rubrisoli]|uniref:Gfo/Idh/MocA family oxidoreductase n=1 Tax=Ktedonosporobacter rubrisoli TaxID=2509675 RepID=A0A4P6JRV0_KTERU|nr:Gfo/Idh/MocA family oxidoreductase [Ktedonosporobacter rubrisoli]QBD78035.1 Gfo/Idh/MocA family oxidoreductase [Ktedonosporobacter rubrisoli]